MGILILLLIVIGAGLLGRFIFLTIFDSVFGKPKDEYPYDSTYIDNSVHHHYHDNRSVHVNGEDVTKHLGRK